MAMITRTIVNKTIIKYKTVINGVVSDNEKTLEPTIEPEHCSLEPFARKRKKWVRLILLSSYP